MTQWLAGMKITAARLNDFTPVAVTGTVTAATNFSVTSFVAYDAGGQTWFAVQLTYSGSTITASSSGDITDTQCCTLPSALIPPAATWLPYKAGNTADGIVQIDTGGVCKLQTLSPTATITASSSINFSGVIATG